MVAPLWEQLQELNTGGKRLLQFLLKIGWCIGIWKGKLKTRLFVLVNYSQTESFNILAMF